MYTYPLWNSIIEICGPVEFANSACVCGVRQSFCEYAGRETEKRVAKEVGTGDVAVQRALLGTAVARIRPSSP